MHGPFLLLLLLILGCDDYNSNSADKIKYEETSQQEVSSGDPNFQAAFAVIQNRCISCHDGQHNNWASYTNDDHWLSSGLVNRGDPSNSRLIRRIVNSGDPGANMPPAGAIPDAEFQLLKRWITELP